MEANRLKELAAGVLRTDFSDVTLCDSEGVLAKREGGMRTAGGATVPQKLRALTLLSMQAGGEDFCIRQQPRFRRLGAMLDMSRGGVMRIERVKEYIDRLALFGANMLMLYTEDIFLLEDYPHFGYLRGAYTDAELRELDDYAASLGVEIIPCIQTLGHHGQYLSWREETAGFRDNDNILLCDSEATYRFIEAQIAKMRAVFRSRNIHVGMDEADGVGLGAYLRQHGFTDRFQLLRRHLGRVVDLCAKYDFEPMMWSDMFFRLGSPTGSYYDKEFHLPEGLIGTIPPVSMVYWDYYHEDVEDYRRSISFHRQLGRPIVFAGGLWTWSGFLPCTGYNFESMRPAMQACAEARIDDVFATFWGDDGCETDYFRGLYSFGIFSEACYLGPDASEEAARAMGEWVTGYTTEQMLACDVFQEKMIGKRLIWADLFYGIGCDTLTGGLPARLLKASGSPSLGEDPFARLTLEIAAIKAYALVDLPRRYREGGDLTPYRDTILPRLLADYRALSQQHARDWRALNKMFGYELIAARYAATIDRLTYEMGQLESLLRGEIDRIEELEYTPLEGMRDASYRRIAFPSASA